MFMQNMSVKSAQKIEFTVYKDMKACVLYNFCSHTENVKYYSLSVTSFACSLVGKTKM